MRKWSALSGLDIALWDIKGKKLGVPVWQLLGGKVRDRIKVYGWIGGDSPQAVLEGAAKRKEQGFTAVKMNGTGMSAYYRARNLVSPDYRRGRLDRFSQRADGHRVPRARSAISRARRRGGFPRTSAQRHGQTACEVTPTAPANVHRGAAATDTGRRNW